MRRDVYIEPVDGILEYLLPAHASSAEDPCEVRPARGSRGVPNCLLVPHADLSWGVAHADTLSASFGPVLKCLMETVPGELGVEVVGLKVVKGSVTRVLRGVLSVDDHNHVISFLYISLAHADRDKLALGELLLNDPFSDSPDICPRRGVREGFMMQSVSLHIKFK